MSTSYAWEGVWFIPFADKRAGVQVTLGDPYSACHTSALL